jgi:hypothetical protein
MGALPFSLLTTFCSCLRSRAAMRTEILALRHRRAVLQQSNRGRPRPNVADRILWLWPCRFWARWRPALAHGNEEWRTAAEQKRLATLEPRHGRES